MHPPSLRVLCALVSLLALSGPRLAGQQGPAPAIQVKTDLAYAAGGPEFTLDVAYAAEPAARSLRRRHPDPLCGAGLSAHIPPPRRLGSGRRSQGHGCLG